MRLKPVDIKLLGVITLLFSISFIIAAVVIKQWSLYLFLPVMFSMILIFIVEAYRRVQRHIEQQTQRSEWTYWQTESLFSIYSLVQPVRPIPHMRSWAASPDFCALVLSEIHDGKPKTIVEVGSGVSTILSAYGAKKYGGRRIFSLEHDENYASYCNKLLKLHG